jgi:hypothetical protein
MRTVRARFSVRMLPGVGLLGLAIGCSGCGESMSGESENQQQQEAIRVAMTRAYADGMAFGRGGKPVKTLAKSSAKSSKLRVHRIRDSR